MRRELQIGDIIAERRLTYESAAGESRPVVVTIGRPVLDPAAPNETWMCAFQIQGVGSDQVRGMFGVDAMHALLLAIHTIPAELAAYIRDVGGQFVYLGDIDASFVSSCRTALEYAGDVFPPIG